MAYIPAQDRYRYPQWQFNPMPTMMTASTSSWSTYYETEWTDQPVVDDHYDPKSSGVGQLPANHDSPRSQFLSSPSPSPDSFADSDSQPRRPSSPLSFSPAPSVKEEPDDDGGCFIMELSAPQANSTLLSQSLAPPTEVPLRATQASSDMRRMMTVFRLNPFAIHSGGSRGTVPAKFEKAHALESAPLTFEFQLDIEPGILDPEGGGGSDDLDDAELRSFSPDFELYDKVDKKTTGGKGRDTSDDYADANETRTATTGSPVPSQSWQLSYPDNDDPFSPISVPSYHNHNQHRDHRRTSPSRRQPRAHNRTSPPLTQVVH
ncbi:hypothetical protein DXG01_003790 [Tephrocybe rancida]|nr:hypothetical protein DXG01_003790 [Tephrocybe rancida]